MSKGRRPSYPGQQHSREDVERAWGRFLDPNEVKNNLTAAMAFVAGFEILKDVVVEELRKFYSLPSQDVKYWEVSPDYELKVTSRSKDIAEASLDWLKESGAIVEFDIETYQRLRKLRNEVVHKFHDFLSIKDRSVFVQEFPQLASLTRKVEIWWLREVIYPTGDHPGHVPEDATPNWDEAKTGGAVMVEWMAHVALSSMEVSDSYLRDLFSQKPDA